MAQIIPKCGFNRNTKRDIIFGPMELGGANFRHLYDQQGIGQVQLFLKLGELIPQPGNFCNAYCIGTNTQSVCQHQYSNKLMEKSPTSNLNGYAPYDNTSEV
jgi:hypothetical protein